MKLMKKFMILMNMLFVGLTLQTVHSVNPAMNTGVTEIAKAAGSYATLKDNMGNGPETLSNVITLSTNSDLKSYNLVTLVITTNASYVKPGYIEGCPIEVGTESSKRTDGCHIASYFYARQDNPGQFDAVFYANVDTIYAPKYCNGLFYSWSDLVTIHFDNFNTSKTIMMTGMFEICGQLREIKGIENFDTSNVTDMENMFAWCQSLKSVDLHNFDTSKVTKVKEMFEKCRSLEELDMSGMDLSNVTSGLDTMFIGVDGKIAKLDVIYAPKEMGNNVMTLPSYFTTEASNATLNSSTENKVILCSNTKYTDPNSSKTYTVSDLANEIMKLNTCTDYNQAAYLLEKYNALSAEDKAIFDMVDSRTDNATLTNKLTYMNSVLAANSKTASLSSYTAITAKQGHYALIAIIAFSIIAILGYQMIQKKKYVK